MASVKLPPKAPTEDDVQRVVVQGLRILGLEVRSTVVRGFSGRKDGKGYGSDKGIPDLFVRHPSWPACAWLGLEVKRPGGGWSGAEQKALWEGRHTARVTSLEQAAFAVCEHFRDLDAAPPVHLAALAARCTEKERPRVIARFG